MESIKLFASVYSLSSVLRCYECGSDPEVTLPPVTKELNVEIGNIRILKEDY